MTEPRWNIHEGTISFWVRKNRLRWNDGLRRVLLNLSQHRGRILIVKDSDNKLKFFHVALGRESDAETDVSHLSSSQDHFIAVTWSYEKGEINLFVDGQVATTSKMQMPWGT